MDLEKIKAGITPGFWGGAALGYGLGYANWDDWGYGGDTYVNQGALNVRHNNALGAANNTTAQAKKLRLIIRQAIQRLSGLNNRQIENFMVHPILCGLSSQRAYGYKSSTPTTPVKPMTIRLAMAQIAIA